MYQKKASKSLEDTGTLVLSQKLRSNFCCHLCRGELLLIPINSFFLKLQQVDLAPTAAMLNIAAVASVRLLSCRQ